jgi:hypothetical protein
MRNTFLAAATAFVLVVGSIPTFAADTNTDAAKTGDQQQAQGQSGNGSTKCGDILANPDSYTKDQVESCKAAK